MARTGQGGRAVRGVRVARSLLGLLCLVPGAAAWAGNFSLFGVETDYKITLGYATAMRMEEQDPALINGPIDIQQVELDANPATCPTIASGTPCLGGFGHTGLPDTTNFDDGNRDFKKGALLNNRVSAYGEMQLPLDFLGVGNVGAIASGAAHYDQVLFDTNDHDNPDSVNRVGVTSHGRNRFGPVNEWLPEAEDTTGMRQRLLEAYVYGEWYLTDTIGLSLRGGKHLAAWGESLFFPGIVSAQGPFDATKANVPGVEVKEILLPVNQVSMQLALTQDLTVLAYNQFEFKPTEIFPQGDFFSPADLVGPGSNFGYGSINPISDRWCSQDDPGPGQRVHVTDATTGADAPNDSLCMAGAAFVNEPEYILITRNPDKMPSENDQFGAGLKYQLTPDFNLGAYYIRYNNHNPEVLLDLSKPARIGDFATPGCTDGQPEVENPACTEATTADLGLTIPSSYTVSYAEGVQMHAVSFSTVLWVFNIGGEIIRRDNVDLSLEADILGAISPVATRGRTTTAQMSFLYVNNPDFLMYDEVVVVGEMSYTTVDKVQPRKNEPGICYTGTNRSDCDDAVYQEHGSNLFYDKDAYAIQVLTMPKGRNVFAGWDISTPVTFAWLIDGTPSTPGVFGALYGEGDMRIAPGVTAQYVQNLEFALTYNAFLGDPAKNIRNSPLRANPYTDHDYLSLSIKYNL